MASEDSLLLIDVLNRWRTGRATALTTKVDILQRQSRTLSMRRNNVGASASYNVRSNTCNRNLVQLFGGSLQSTTNHDLEIRDIDGEIRDNQPVREIQISAYSLLERGFAGRGVRHA